MDFHGKSVVLVIGMHRSGTSFLTRYLNSVGYSIGVDIMKASFDNPKGFYENKKLVELNNQLLHRLNATWDRPYIDSSELMNLDLYVYFLKELKYILREEFKDDTCLLIKDPRISVLFPIWSKALKELSFDGVKVILSLRNPNAIAESLLKRNGLTSDQAHFLTLEYLSKAETYSRQHDRMFFHFEKAIGEPDIEEQHLREFLNHNSTCFLDKGKMAKLIDLSLLRQYKNIGDQPSLIAYEFLANSRMESNMSYKYLNDIYEAHNSDKSNLVSMLKDVILARVVYKSEKSVIPTYVSRNEVKSGINVISEKYDTPIECDTLEFFPLNRSASIKVINFEVNGVKVDGNSSPLFRSNGRDFFDVSYPVYRIYDVTSVYSVLIEYELNHVGYNISSLREILSINPSSETHKIEKIEEQTLEIGKDILLIKDVVTELKSDLQDSRFVSKNLNNEIQYLKESRVSLEQDYKNRIAILKEEYNQKLIDEIERSLSERHEVQLSYENRIFELNRDFRSQRDENNSSIEMLKLRISNMENHLLLAKEELVEKIESIGNLEYTLLKKTELIDSKNIVIQDQHLEINSFKTNYSLRERELDAMSNSFSYKLGRALTWPIRMCYDMSGQGTALLLALGGMLGLLVRSPFKTLQSITFENINTLKKALFREPPSRILMNARRKIGLPINLKSLEPRNLSVKERNSIRKKRVLYISPDLPDYDKSSGGRRATKMIELLCEDCEVHVFTLRNRPQKYIDKLSDVGAIVHDHKSHDRLFSELENVDTIIFAWYYTLHDNRRVMEKYAGSQIIVDSVDVHWVREERSIGEVDGLTIEKVVSNKEVEIASYQNADVIWVVSEEDKKSVLKEVPAAHVIIVSNIHDLENETFRLPDNKNILFLGGYNHPPNLKAVRILAKSILPDLKKTHREATLTIAGANAPFDVVSLGDLDGVTYKGFIPESELKQLYEEAFICVSPLTAGAGIKGKICEAIAYNKPVLTTPIGNEGINLIHTEEGFISEPDGMSDQLVKIFNGQFNLKEISKKAQLKLMNIVGQDIAKMRMRESIYSHVAICIVTWNRLELLQRCIESIEKYTKYHDYSIIVHSNGCEDGTQPYLKAAADINHRIIPILSKTNDVFVRPNNAMMKMYPSSDVVLLNNDTYVTDGWLTALREAAYSHHEIGITGSKILYPDGRLQEFGSELYEDGTGRNIGKWDDPTKSEYLNIKRVGYVSGCSMYIKRDTINKIGCFDDSFHPCYCEDSDYSYTAWEHGIQTVVTPNSIIYHDEGSTSGTDDNSGFKAYQKVNFEKFLRKHEHNLSSISDLIRSYNVQKMTSND